MIRAAPCNGAVGRNRRSARNPLWAFVIAALIFLVAASPVAARPAVGTTIGTTCDIKQFLDECPDSDAAYAQIRADFVIRKDGVLVGSIACQAPVSQIPIAQYTDEVIVLQALRTIYYLDKGRTGHLPWTPGSLYDWLKARAGGINITTSGPDQCCSSSFGDGRAYFNVRAKNDSTRDWQRSWVGMAELIGLMMHERRHADPAVYPHVGCCSVGANACDQEYNEANLSAYGIQWWLRRQFIEGGIYTGYACLGAQEVADIKSFLRNTDNSERDRYCQNPPPLLTDANNPADACRLCIARIRDYYRIWRWIPPWIPISILAVVVLVAWVAYRRVRRAR
jgi:hypothetical protein